MFCSAETNSTPQAPGAYPRHIADAGEHLARNLAPVLGRPAAPKFPFAHRPGSVVLLDDELDYLEMLTASLPKHWHVRAFANADSCLNHLQQEPPRWERDYWIQQSIVAAWKQAGSMPDLPRRILDYWARQPDRFDLTKVCVFDYMLPGPMSGLDALAELVDWPGHRVLITGAFDDNLAINAFNRGLIDQFLTKQSAQTHDQIAGVVDGMMRRCDERAHMIWASTLNPDQAELLRDDSIARDLRDFAERTWSEWICIGKPFGVLGQDHWGGVSWLQLQPASSLHRAASEAADSGFAAKDVRAIGEGRCVTDIEFQHGLGRPDGECSVLPAFYIGESAALLGAIQKVHSARGVGFDLLGYRTWLDQPARSQARG